MPRPGRKMIEILPDVMICVHPGCKKLAVHDSLGQSGLCRDHLKGAHSYLLGKRKDQDTHANG